MELLDLLVGHVAETITRNSSMTLSLRPPDGTPVRISILNAARS